jgi:hypothetical protein
MTENTRGKHIEIEEQTHLDLKIFTVKNKLKSFDSAIKELLKNASRQ